MEDNSGSGDWIEEFSNCTLRYDSTNYKVLAGLRATAGFISFLCCAAVVIIIILFKKYKFFSQRLILNVAVAAMIHSISYTTGRVNYYTTRPIEDKYCYFGGLFNHYTAAVELISIWCITINIFSVGMHGKSTVKLEPVYILATYALPLLWFWVPLWKQAYGTSGGWCGIKFLQADCTPFTIGTYIQFGIWYIPLYISTFIITALMIIVAIKILRSRHIWQGKFDPLSVAVKQALSEELQPLIWYPILYLLLNSFSFISQIYRAVFPASSSPVLPYLRVLTSPFRGAAIAVVFALDRSTRNRLNRAHCKAACLDWYGDRTEINELRESTIYGDQEADIPYKRVLTDS